MRKRAVNTFFVFSLLLAILPLVSAQVQQYHLPILAVQETKDGYAGSKADLYLELKEGSGRVFLETYPLTKTDTQASTRFAKNLACNHYKLDCDSYDFIYTIRADSSIIGGPSASAAISVLTTIALLDLDYKENIAITGTINSGGIIGPVGGVKEKLEAAAQQNISKVLIAKGNVAYSPLIEVNNKLQSSNESLNLIDYGRENLSLEVVEVLDLDQVIFEFTGKNLNHKNITIKEDQQYSVIMKKLSDDLCKRTSEIIADLADEEIELSAEENSSYFKKMNESDKAASNNDFYSTASYCFGANIDLKKIYYEHTQSSKTVELLFQALESKASALGKKIKEQQIETIADLQAKIIVEERLNDVDNQLEAYHQNQYDDFAELSYLLAYAEERYYSTISWMQFFAMDGKTFMIDSAALQESCQMKISEAEENYQYALIFLGGPLLEPISQRLNIAKNASAEQQPELCLIKASQAKADASAILSSLGSTNGTIKDIIEGKKKAVERVIAENSAEGIFPILGYSYYQYALSLQEQDEFTALVYMEYALEMSNLEIYFPEKKSALDAFYDNLQLEEKWIYLFIGAAVGLVAGMLIKKKKCLPKKENSLKNKHI